MENKAGYTELSLESLKERAKELNCLYRIEEILNNKLLSLTEVFEGIIREIPAGWQFPDLCQARIVYENHSYQMQDYRTSLWTDACNIKIGGRTVGTIEVSYIKEIPRHKEGYFLEKERKLIRTIADRIGQTILHRQMERILKEWEFAKQELSEINDAGNEWVVIIDLLRRVNQTLLSHLCRKMINYLYRSGIEEVKHILNKSSPDGNGALNKPSLKQPIDDIISLSEKTFKVASRHMSGEEISLRLKKWMGEEKYYFLINATERIDSSTSEIIEVITRNKLIIQDNDVHYSPKERCLQVSLLLHFFSDKPEFVNIAKQYIKVSDFYEIANRIIFPAGSRGKLGGKSAGLFLAQKILEEERKNLPELGAVKVPKTWYITSDEITHFLYYNNLEDLIEQKYKDLTEIRIEYPHIIQMMKNSHFPPEIVKSLAMALDDFGEVPLIVRSSSLLEDQIGAVFPGKYKSLFLANQGSKKKRLEALMDAIVEVYASVFSPDSIQYRNERELLDYREEMGIMIQEVVGVEMGSYYLPVFAGVASSNNEFLWSSQLKREDGLVRLVLGLGTRAVDRINDDFPVFIAPGQPDLRVNSQIEEIVRYSPKRVDSINLIKNTFETIDVNALISENNGQIPYASNIFTIYDKDYTGKLDTSYIDSSSDNPVITFEGLTTNTSFINQIRIILKTLQDKMNTPVEIEFACDGSDIFLLQCRPQNLSEDNLACPIPKDIDGRDVIFSSKRYTSNGRIPEISYIVYVDPDEYDKLDDLNTLLRVGMAVSSLNLVLPKRQFVLVGPGRWGSRGDIKKGVNVSYSDINNTAALIEVARTKAGYMPELSYGTHFFQDLIESNIRYIPLYPDEDGLVFNEVFLRRSKNLISEILPHYYDLEDVIKVIDIPRSNDGKILRILMNAELCESIGYLTLPSAQAVEEKAPVIYKESGRNDEYWRWRHYMAERIAERIDSKKFGVKALYLFGSTNNASSGPGSDIDLLIHFEGTEHQREELENWLVGWSQCLDEMNYLKTGYKSKGLLDVHIVTDEDIAKKTSFALKIGAVTDPATPLKLEQV